VNISASHVWILLGMNVNFQEIFSRWEFEFPGTRLDQVSISISALPILICVELRTGISPKILSLTGGAMSHFYQHICTLLPPLWVWSRQVKCLDALSTRAGQLSDTWALEANNVGDRLWISHAFTFHSSYAKAAGYVWYGIVGFNVPLNTL